MTKDRYSSRPLVWTKYNRKAVLPRERKNCLLQIAEREEEGLPPAVAVGYGRWWSDGHFWVIPGLGGSTWEVTHYADCLPEDFKAPLWTSEKKRAAIMQRLKLEVER